MKYIILDKFTNTLVVDQNNNTLEFDLEQDANLEASKCQNGLVIPLNTTKLFTKAQIIDLLIDLFINSDEIENI